MNYQTKILLASFITLVFNAQTKAQNTCSITYNTDSTLSTLIDNKGFSFDNYDKVCQLLKNANASIDIQTVTQITPYQTTAAVSIRLKAREIDAQKVRIFSYASNWVRFDEERTSSTEKDALYNVTMSALNGINQEMVDDLNKQRSYLKSYKPSK